MDCMYRYRYVFNVWLWLKLALELILELGDFSPRRLPRFRALRALACFSVTKTAAGHHLPCTGETLRGL